MASLPLPEDDRFWAAALDMQMPLTVHVAFNRMVSVLNSPPLSTGRKSGDLTQGAARSRGPNGPPGAASRDVV